MHNKYISATAAGLGKEPAPCASEPNLEYNVTGRKTCRLTRPSILIEIAHLDLMRQGNYHGQHEFIRLVTTYFVKGEGRNTEQTQPFTFKHVVKTTVYAEATDIYRSV